MRTNSKRLTIITMIYIYLPILLFLIGFTKWWVWILTCIFSGFSIWRLYKDINEDNLSVDAPIVQCKMSFVAASIIILICLILGFGGLFVQSGDWPKHNAILHDLIDKEWPVYYRKNEPSLLTYYLGQYIVPGLLGKITKTITHSGDKGFDIGSATMAMWAMIGIFLVFLNLVRITKSNTWIKQLRCLLILFFFSGALPLVQIVTSGIYQEDMYSLGSFHWLMFKGISIQYRSNLVMLRWVYPQVIVIWLIVILFLEHNKHVCDYVIIIAPVLLFGTFSIAMLAVLAFISVIVYFIKADKKIEYVFDVLSMSNLLAFLSLGLVELMYFIGYLQVVKPEFMSFKVADIKADSIWGIIIFDLFMFGIYIICVAKYNRSNHIFWGCAVLLSIIPFFKMGIYNDFVMCTSIPGLFIVMIYVIKALNINENTKEYGVRTTIIIICILIGAWYPLMEVRDSLYYFKNCASLDNRMDFFGTLEQYTDRDSEESKDLIYNYYTYDLEGKFFYEVFARKKLGK